jgi:hypothetical protein
MFVFIDRVATGRSQLAEELGQPSKRNQPELYTTYRCCRYFSDLH